MLFTMGLAGCLVALSVLGADMPGCDASAVADALFAAGEKTTVAAAAEVVRSRVPVTCAALLGLLLLLVGLAAHVASRRVCRLVLVDVATGKPLSTSRCLLHDSLVVTSAVLLGPADAGVRFATRGRSVVDLIMGTHEMRPASVRIRRAAVGARLLGPSIITTLFMVGTALGWLALVSDNFMPASERLGPNLIANGDFSDGLRGWQPKVFRGLPSDVRLVEEAGRGNIVVMSQGGSSAETGGEWAALGQRLRKLRVNALYEFTVQYKVPEHQQMRVGFRLADASLVRTAMPLAEGSWNVDSLIPDGRWHTLRFRFRTTPERPGPFQYLSIVLDYDAGEGSVFVDNVSMRRVFEEE
jgi:hypothetical protein